jgi:hypothetical protein
VQGAYTHHKDEVASRCITEGSELKGKIADLAQSLGLAAGAAAEGSPSRGRERRDRTSVPAMRACARIRCAPHPPGLARHQRFTFHFTPTSCSWANAVEGLFATLTRQRLKRGVFTSIVELQTAINRFIAETNDKPKPFVWTKSADAILAAVNRGRQALEAIH